MAGAALTISPAARNAKAATIASPWVHLENPLSYESQTAARCALCSIAITAMTTPCNVSIASAHLILFLFQSHLVYPFDSSV